MKSVAAALLLAPAVSAHLTLFSNVTAANRYAFESFKADFGRSYNSPEEDVKRFEIFTENLKLIDERNALDSVHGITRFADLTQAEFAARYLKALPKPVPEGKAPIGLPKPLGATVDVDWRGVWTTPVKNQGYCGSCWAFSAVEQIETDYWMASGSEAILSPQQVTSCDQTAYGCNGGWTEHAYEYVIRAGGIEGDSDYPYTSGTAGVTGSCKSNAADYVVSIGGYETVSSSASGETAMANYVAATGPLSICVDAETWSSYSGGVMSVCGQSVDHCVQAVGLDTAAASPYWIVRNSWGVTWGNAGYIYLAYGKNTCNLASDATYVTGAVAYGQ